MRKNWKLVVVILLLSIFSFWIAGNGISDDSYYMSKAEAILALFFYLLGFAGIIAAGVITGKAVKDAIYREKYLDANGKVIESPDFLKAVDEINQLSDRDAFDSARYKGVALEGLEKLYLTEDLKSRIRIYRNGDGGVTLKTETCTREAPRRALERGSLAYWTTCWNEVKNFASLADAVAAVPERYKEDDLSQHFWRKITVRRATVRGRMWVNSVTVFFDGKVVDVDLNRGMTFAVSSAAHVVKIGDSFFFLPPAFGDELWDTYVKERPMEEGVICGVERSVVNFSPAEVIADGTKATSETAAELHLPETGKEDVTASNGEIRAGKENAPALNEEMSAGFNGEKGAETLIAEDSRSFKDGREEIAPTATGETNSAMPQGENAETRSESAEIPPDNRQGKGL